MKVKSIRRCQSKEVNQCRQSAGQYHTLFSVLRRDPEEFYDYTRMKIETFDYIYKRIKPKLGKRWCNLHKRAIFEEEQLVITIR